MPKVAYSLAWSSASQAYNLYNERTERDLALDLDSSAWYEWLGQTVSFAFRGRRGVYTARREQIKPGDWYWYAYQRSQKRVRKKYLGKSEALTLQRLEEVAQRFNDEQLSGDKTTTGAMAAQVHSVAQEQLLLAKLRIPLAPQHLVARTHLLARLQGVLERPVTLISASAGSGKSTLLSSWLRQEPLASAWLSLDQADNDAGRFWPYFFSALDTLYPGVGEHALDVLRFLQTPSMEQVLTLLINQLGDGTPMLQAEADGVAEALLVLDDYHVISVEAIHQDMAFLLEHLPPHLHVIISTRHDPPLPLARLRVHDRLLELRTADLCFSNEEIVAFFARRGVTSLSPEEIALLEERTAGWAVGLQLVALLLHDQRERSDVLRSIHGSQRYLAEYFGQEVLVRLPEALQQFLLRTSILEQLESGLCEAVSGQPDGEETLAWLFQANLFLTPLDESHRWYRYHQIFAEVLRQRLQQSAAVQIPELHRRASRWYRTQRMLVEAVAHARSAGDWESIASIAEESGVELISRGETRMVLGWVAMLPRPLVFSRLRLFLYECWWRWYSGHAAVVAEMAREYIHLHGLPGLEIEDAAILEQAIGVHVDALYPLAHWNEEQRASRIAETLALYGVLAIQRSDGAAFSQAACRRAVALVAGQAHRARIIQHLSTVCILRGDLAEAAATMEEALASAIADGSASWVSSIGYRLGMLYEMQGQLQDVTRISQEILQLATGKTFLTHGTAYIFLGSVEYEHNHLEAAERYFKMALAISKETNPIKEGNPDLYFLLGQLRLARIKFIWRDRAGVHQCLEEVADYLALEWMGAEVLPVVKGEYALLMYDLGDETAGRQWLEEYFPLEHGGQLLLRQFISLNHSHPLVSMKMLLAYQRWQEAEQVLQNQQALAEQQGRMGSLIQWLTMRALLTHAQGDTEQAISSLARALALAEPRGYRRVFLDEGVRLLPLLYRLRNELRNQRTADELAPTPGYLDRLMLLFKQEQQTSLFLSEHARQPLVELLSGRELEVLRHLSEGRSNREIAEQLIIAPSTVKSHIRAIYAKLEVESRTQALAQARRLNLL